VRKVILKITDVIFGKIRVGAWHVTLYHLAMGLSSALLFVSSSKLMSKSKNGGETVHFQNPHCERFRAERNFWISILAFTMWVQFIWLTFCWICADCVPTIEVSHSLHILIMRMLLLIVRWLILSRFIAITREAERYRSEILKSETGKKDR
jgi:hypothetical protein